MMDVVWKYLLQLNDYGYQRAQCSVYTYIRNLAFGGTNKYIYLLSTNLKWL